MIDPFFLKIAQAYEQVAVDHSRKITVIENGQQATITYYPKTDTILIGINQAPPDKPPTLVVP